MRKTNKILLGLTSIPLLVGCFAFFKANEIEETKAFDSTQIKYDFSSSESWNTSSLVASSSTYGYDTNNYFDQSKNSYHVKYLTNGVGYLLSNKSYALTPGQYYNITYWLKSKNATERSTIQLYLIDPNNANNNYQFKTVTLNGSSSFSDWIEVKSRFLVPETLTSFRPQFNISSGQGEFYIDSLILQPVENMDVLSKNTSFELSDSGSYGAFKRVSTGYEMKITEIEDYDYYSIALNLSESATAKLSFVDYRGNVIDFVNKSLNSGDNEIYFQSPSCTYALLEVDKIPNSYTLTRVGKNNIVKSDIATEKTHDGKPFADLQSKVARHGEAYYISKANCTNTQYRNFYYYGMFQPLIYTPEKTFTFEYYLKIDNASSDFAFDNSLLTRKELSDGSHDVYIHNFVDKIDDLPASSFSKIKDGKWHKISKTVTPSDSFHAQYYWIVNAGSADVYIDDFKVTWTASKYNNIPLSYKATELNLYEYENYQFVKKETETTSRITNSTLYVDEVETSPIIYLEPNNFYYMKNEATIKMGKSHLDLYCTYFGGLNDMWKEDGSIDFEEFDRSINQLLMNGPNVRVMVNFGMFAPDWWGEQNPDEISLIYTSSTDSYKASNNFSPNNPNGVSFASAKYITEASDVLRRIYAHMQEQDYFNSIFAFKLSAGRTYEWMTYGMGTDNPGHLGDYSPASLSGFKKYLLDKYATISNLNSAWGTSYASFDAVQAPTWSERTTNSSKDSFYKNQRIVDFNLFASDAASEMLLSFAKLMKELCNNNKIVGAYNGYVWLGGSYSMLGTCHSTFNKVITSPYIDFVSSPLNYGERVLGQTSAFMTLNDTVRANGKLYILEDDNRTSFRNQYGEDESDSLNTALGVAQTTDETIKYQKSDFANEFINGSGMWYYDMTGNWFDNDQYYQMLQLEKNEMDHALKGNVDYVNDIALFIDEETNAYTIANSNSYIHQLLSCYPTIRKELSRVGTGYDVYSLNSLVEGKVPNHKVNLIVGAINLNDEEVNAINTYLKKNNNFVIFCGPMGYGNNSNWDISNVSNLVGMTISKNSNSYGLRVKINYSEMPSIIFGDVGTNTAYSTRVSGSGITSLGKLVNASSYNGLAMKNMGEWTSIYSSSWYVPAELIRFACSKAGVHLYTEEPNDTIYSNSNYVGITATSGGLKTINLPGNYIVYDVFADKYVSSKAINQIQVNMDVFDTKVYRLEPSEREITIYDGTSTTTNTYNFGDIIHLKATEKEYYEYKGFYTNDELITENLEYDYTITNSCTIAAKYEPIVYTITFKDGENIVKKYEYTIEDYSKVVSPKLEEKEHASYIWEDYTLFSSRDIVVNSKWSYAAKYNVTFKDGLETVKSIEIFEGERILSTQIPMVSKEGKTFNGWLYNNESFDFNTPITKNIELTASWSTIVNTITLKDGENTIKTLQIEYGSTIPSESLPALEKEGKIFNGWYLNGSLFDLTTPIKGNLTLNASWEDIAYTITFMDEDKIISEVKVGYGEKIPSNLIPKITKQYETFDGWFVNGEIFDFDSEITEDITLTAKFNLTTYFTLTFKDDNGDILNTYKVKPNSSFDLSTLVGPEKEDYTFNGWSMNDILYLSKIIVNRDMTFTANYKYNGNVITIKSDNGSTMKVEYLKPGSSFNIDSLVAPQKDGYNFVGWYINGQKYTGNITVASDLTITATYEKTTNPEPTPEKKGCFGSIIGFSLLVSAASLCGSALLIYKKRKED